MGRIAENSAETRRVYSGRKQTVWHAREFRRKTGETRSRAMRTICARRLRAHEPSSFAAESAKLDGPLQFTAPRASP